jgi:hypothetical protein
VRRRWGVEVGVEVGGEAMSFISYSSMFNACEMATLRCTSTAWTTSSGSNGVPGDALSCRKLYYQVRYNI